MIVLILLPGVVVIVVPGVVVTTNPGDGTVPFGLIHGISTFG
jgi:hypothetical protein